MSKLIATRLRQYESAAIALADAIAHEYPVGREVLYERGRGGRLTVTEGTVVGVAGEVEPTRMLVENSRTGHRRFVDYRTIV